MSLKQNLDKIPIPPFRNPGEKLNKYERLKTLFEKLKEAPRTSNAEDTLQLINATITAVEDWHSGMIAEANPGRLYIGRMYPIQEDNIERKDGRIIAKTSGNFIYIEANGSFTITSRIDEEVLIQQIYE